jgi:hypothetical protein
LITRRGALQAILFVSATALSCGSRVAYSPPAVPAGDPTIIVPAPFEETWSAVIQTFFEKNIPIKTLEKASGILESDDLHGELGRVCDCGSWLGMPIGGYGTYGGDAYYRYRILVEKREPDKTSLTLKSSCRGRHQGLEGDLVCQLAPAIESGLRKAIADRVAKSAGTAR